MVSIRTTLRRPVDLEPAHRQSEQVSSTGWPAEDTSPIRPERGLWQRHPWIIWALIFGAVLALLLAANEIYQARTSAASRSRANAVIDSIPVPPWMVEIDRIEVGFTCHPWSDCQEQFLTAVYEIDIDKATQDERERPCDSLMSALRQWAPVVTGTACTVRGQMNRSQLYAGLYENAHGDEPLSQLATLEQGEYVRIAIYP